jgi:protein involved in polysaccharide export with SLBB domain
MRKGRFSFQAMRAQSMRKSDSPLRWSAIAVVVVGTMSLCVPARAQSYSSDRAGVQKSRAEQEADAKVAFSAETIIGILRHEPGLLLQVKKVLVREAYEQGRVLEESDLTDDKVFQLLRENQQIRVLATHEIEDRAYIRAKPTQAQIERENALAAQYGVASGMSVPPSNLNQTSNQTAPTSGAGMSQEQQYWTMHDRLMGPYGIPNQIPQTNSPMQAPPQQQTPAPNTPENPQRQLKQASSQQQGFDNTDQDTSGTMPRIGPDQLSALLNTNPQAALALTSTSTGRTGAGMAPGAGTQMASASMPDIGSSSNPYSWSSNGTSSTSTPDQSRYPARQPRYSVDLNQDRPQIRQKPNPYADVPSLYDLYMQVSRRPPMLQEFGMDVFRNGTGNADELPLDLPVGPDYILGPGDGLSIELWGAVSQRLQRVVDRAGLVALPEVGTVHVAGRTLGDVQRMVQSVLRTQFRDVAADVSLGRIRTIRVYVVGDVERPGAYDISSLSTPLNALYAAGGPTSRGSLRHIRQFRGKQLIQDIDAYDLLLHGIHSELARIESGDTILVQPLGQQVTVEGMVRRPAQYELGGEKTLSEILQLAGGVLPSGTLRHIDVERVVAHESRTMLRLDIPESNDGQTVNAALDAFQVQDGDKIRISPILPYSDKTVYLDGHVFHPGKYPYREGMTVADLIHSYRDLLPEPSQRHAEIIRLEAPDYRPVVLTFNLSDAMNGKATDLTLKPFDTVRVYSRFDFEDAPLVTVNGEVRDPGDHITNGATRLRDAIYLAGGLTPDAENGDVQVYRKTTEGKLKVLSANLTKALANDPGENILLQPKDQVLIARNSQKEDPATVRIEGEVANPGRYPLGEDMTAAQLVRLAGGFKRGADVELADLMSYPGPAGGEAIGEQRSVQIAKALAGVADTDVVLHDGDVLSIRQLPGWNDRGAFVTIKGEVVRPGSYGIHEGERLSSVLERAGGFRSGVYTYGTILERATVREIQEKDRADLISRVKIEGASLKLAPESDPEQQLAKDAAVMQWQAALEKLESMPPTGRMVIRVSSDVKRWAGTQWDPVLRSGDVVTFPKKPNYVMVNGAVFNSTAITYRSGKPAGWYLTQAGGATPVANKKAIFLIRADGSVVAGNGGLFKGGVLAAEVRPGDMLVVPERAYTGGSKWKTTLQAAQLVSAVGIAISIAQQF